MSGNIMDRGGEATRAILDSMVEGVISIGPDGCIAAFNPAAEAILGIARDDLIGQPFGTILLQQPGSDEFADAVLDVLQAADDEVERRRELTFTRADGQAVILSVETSALFRQVDGRRQRQGIVCVFTDVTELAALREAERQAVERLEDQHRKLAAAYRDLERSREEAQLSSRRARNWRVGVGVAVVSLFAVAAGGVWWPGGFQPSPSMPGQASPADGIGLTLRPTPVSKTIELKGSLQAGSLVTVTAPFAGVLTEKRFEFGQRVDAGTVLGILDAGELLSQHRDAQAGLIRADERVRELANWEQGSEVTRSRRSLQRAEQQLQSARQKLAETKQLLDLGVVSRQEYQMNLDQERDARAQVEGARDELESIMAKGGPDQVRIARFEQDNARFKLEGIESKLRAATLRAPVDGIVLRPPQNDRSGGSGSGGGGDSEPREAEVGMKLAEGEALFAIGALDTLRVVTSLPEIDINRIRPGMAATVTGEAFPGIALKGRITSIASQAVKSAGGSPLPAFPVTVMVDQVEPDAARAVRLGMTARLVISVYDNPQALLVPPALLSPGPEGYTVRRRNPATRAVETVAVTLGERLPQGVEILSGLESGDVLVP